MERPILFNAPMVRAILDGRKTQTRRIVKGQPWPGIPFIGIDGMVATWRRDYGDDTSMMSLVRLSHGQPGDRLWVRETWAEYADPTHDYRVYYAADDDCGALVRWRPSIHMPRWASRIDLEITAVRVERLQDISEEDALAEGIEGMRGQWKSYTDQVVVCHKPRASFRSLWDSINAKGGYGWDANPWVFVYEFKREKP